MITKENVLHISKLARLTLTDQESELLSEQLTNVLKHFQEIVELDTTNIEPLVSPTEVSVHWRADIVEQEVTPESLVANAPEKSGKLFKVPPVV